MQLISKYISNKPPIYVFHCSQNAKCRPSFRDTQYCVAVVANRPMITFYPVVVSWLEVPGYECDCRLEQPHRGQIVGK
jgi:hypothetical protein